MNPIDLLLLIIIIYLVYLYINTRQITSSPSAPIEKYKTNDKSTPAPRDTAPTFQDIEPIHLENPEFEDVMSIYENREIDDVLCNSNTRQNIGVYDLNELLCPAQKETVTKVHEVTDFFNSDKDINDDDDIDNLARTKTIAEVYDEMVRPEYINIDRETVSGRKLDKCIPDYSNPTLCLTEWDEYNSNVPAYGFAHTLQINNWAAYNNENQVNGGVESGMMAFDPNGDLHKMVELINDNY